MAKRAAIRQKLKAADRRRQRRQAVAPASSASVNQTGSPQVDVTGLVVTAILDHAHALGSSARDVIVVAALNSLLRGTTPSGDQSKLLATQLQQVAQQNEIPTRAFRETLQQILAMATSHRDPRSGDALLRYLAMLSE